MALNDGLNPQDDPPTGGRNRGSNADGNNNSLKPLQASYYVEDRRESSRPKLTVIPGEATPVQPPTYEELMAMYGDISDNMAIMAAEREGLQLQLRRAGRVEAQLRKEIDQIKEDDPKAADIREIVDHWKKKLGHPKIKFSIHDGRADIVRKALKHRDKEELIKAIDGLALLPYVGPQGRTANPNGATRHDRLGLVFKDVETIDRFMAYAERAETQAERDPNRLWAKYEELNAHAMAYMDLVMAALTRRENPTDTMDNPVLFSEPPGD
jgi:hypothetical protein